MARKRRPPNGRYVHRCKFDYLDDELVNVGGLCVITGLPYVVCGLRRDELAYFKAGADPKECFRSIDADDLEFLISGISPEGWKRQWGLG